MKSALFVDFDNVYSGLRRLDPETADKFARDPISWMNWLIQVLEMPEPVSPNAKRRVLVRRCYLNPQVYQRYRPSFNLAGFEIIDCPALTSEGKTSTDIHMVLDIVDLLQHEVHYDEFIVFSADADFTPVLRKLRRWDRRTTVLAIGFPSAAYRASADLLIDQDDFVRRALGFDAAQAAGQIEQKAPPPDRLLDEVNRVIRQTLVESPVPLPLAKLASMTLSQVDGLEASTWAGQGSFRALIETRNLNPYVVEWTGGGVVYDPSRHKLGVDAMPSAAAMRSNGDLRLKVAELIKVEIAKAPQPVSCARLASLIISHYSGLAADWDGRGTFRRLVESIDVAPVEFDWYESGGQAFDPARHSRSDKSQGVTESDQWPDRDLYSLAKQVHDLTGAPLLTPVKYRNLLHMIAADVAATPFQLMETGKRVRDKCRESGQPVSRQDVNYVLRGLMIRGHLFEKGENGVATLGRLLSDNIRSLCLREQMVITSEIDAAIRKWIVD
jgi:hypothetical protein